MDEAWGTEVSDRKGFALKGLSPEIYFCRRGQPFSYVGRLHYANRNGENSIALSGSETVVSYGIDEWGTWEVCLHFPYNYRDNFEQVEETREKLKM